MGLLDTLGGNGLLPFDERWQPVIDALKSGNFDVSGPNAQGLFGSNGLPIQFQTAGVPGNAMAFAPDGGSSPPAQFAGSLFPDVNGARGPQPPSGPPMQAGPQNAQAPATPNSGGGFWSNPGNAPASLFPAAGGIGDRLLGALGGFVHGGSPLGGLSNAIQTLTTGQPTDPIQMRRQAMQSTYEALRTSLPEPIARAAALDPQVMRVVAPQLASGVAYQALRAAGVPEGQARAASIDPKALETIENIRHQRATEQQAATTPVKIGTDAWGADIYAVRDPSAPGGYRRINLSDGSAQPGVVPGSSPQLTGQEYLNTLPPERRALIEKVANYEANPASFSIRNGQRERTIAEASQFRPDYDQRNFASSQAALTKFTSGQQGNAVKSFNVAIDHLDQLAELGTSLKNGDLRPVNALKNWFQTEIGSAAPTNFEGLKAIVGQEVVKAIVANGGGEREREKAAEQVSGASSPEQLSGIVATYKGAMAAQLSSLKQQYEQGTLRHDFDRLLSAKAKAEMAKHQPGAPPPPGAPATAAPAAASTAQPQSQSAIPPPGQRTVGQSYQTPKGPMIWRGNGWEPVSNANSL